MDSQRMLFVKLYCCVGGFVLLMIMLALAACMFIGTAFADPAPLNCVWVDNSTLQRCEIVYDTGQLPTVYVMKGLLYDGFE